MVQTICVYLFLLLSMMFLVSPRVKLKVTLSGKYFRAYDLSLLLAMLIFAVTFGMRYGVGVDHLGYLERYLFYQNNPMPWIFKHYQIGFQKGSELIAKLGVHYWLYFAFWAFIQVYFILYTFKRNQRDVLPFLVLTFIIGGMALSFMNLIRQAIAFAIFVFSVEFIHKHKPVKHYLLLLLAFSFHKSAIILMPIYLMFRYKKTPYFNRIWFQLLLLGISLFILSQNYIKDIFLMLINIADNIGYGNYVAILDSEKEHLLFSLTRSRGIGFYIIVLLNVIFIANSNRLKKYFSNGYFSKIYDLYFVGVVYGYICNGSIVLLRPNYYFGGFTFIIAAYTLLFCYKHLKENRNNVLLFITLLSLYLLLFVAIIYRMDDNTYRFIFFWQEHLFYLKNL